MAKTSCTNPFTNHLGSSSYITNVPYTFSAKEKDAETNFSYFGARYYADNLSIWLSVDPLADKFPNMSPYAAFNNNPIFFTYPTGMASEPHEWYEPKIEFKYMPASVVQGDSITLKYRIY